MLWKKRKKKRKEQEKFGGGKKGGRGLTSMPREGGKERGLFFKKAMDFLPPERERGGKEAHSTERKEGEIWGVTCYNLLSEKKERKKWGVSTQKGEVEKKKQERKG